jgi:hypothetical protein
MATKSDDEQYSPEESRKRLEAALRGARIAGHKPMADIPKKRVAKKKKAKTRASSGSPKRS